MKRYAIIRSPRDKRYKRDTHEVEEVLASPPPTWAAYAADPHKYQKIIDMEYAEMVTAKTAGDHKAYTENLIHLAAALLFAHHAMTCKEAD